MSDAFEKVAAVVPSVYYDAIARLIPGASTVGAFLWARSFPLAKVTTITGLHGVGLTVAALIASYLLGMLLTPLGSAICEGPILILSYIAPKSRLARATSARLWQRIAHIEALSSTAGETLAKMSAEVILFQNLLAGVIVVWISSAETIPLRTGLAAVVSIAVNVAFRTFVLFRRVTEFEALPQTRHRHA